MKFKTDANHTFSADNEIAIPTNDGYSYNYFIDWGDETNNSNVTGDINHTYASVELILLRYMESFLLLTLENIIVMMEMRVISLLKEINFYQWNNGEQISGNQCMRHF